MPGQTATLALSPDSSEQLRLFDLGPDVAALRASATHLSTACRAENTERAYAADWRDFARFCETVGRAPLPASEDTLCVYVASSLKRLKVSTVQRRLHAVEDAHKRAGVAWRGSVALDDVMRGARRVHGTASNGAAALQVEDLRKMCRALLALKSRTGVRDRAILCVGFSAGMRRSDIVALDLKDVHFVKKGLLLQIKRGKTDQEGKGRQIGVFPGRRVATCPVRALKAWIALRGREAGPLFPGHNGKHLTDRSVGNIVKNAVRLAKLQGKRLSPHSLRAGFVTTAAQAGTQETVIMQTTGHRSVQTVARYVRPARLFAKNALAKAL